MLKLSEKDFNITMINMLKIDQRQPEVGSVQLWHDYWMNMSALDSLLLIYEYIKNHFEMPCYLFDTLHMENA